MTTTARPTANTPDLPGAALARDMRPNRTTTEPVLSVPPDPLEDGRVNIVEHRASKGALGAWRATAPRPSGDVAAARIEVLKHRIAHSGQP